MYKTNTPTEYREQLRGRILETAMKEFCARGIKQVKMDDIARKLGISKRTLYEIYANKETLLFEGVKQREEAYDHQIKKYKAEEVVTVIDVMALYYRLRMDAVKNLNPTFFSDLHKYHRIVDYLMQLHAQRSVQIKDFFDAGVKQGYFCADANIMLMCDFEQVVMQYVMEAKLYQKYGVRHVFHNVLLLFIRSICTEKGIALLETKINFFK